MTDLVRDPIDDPDDLDLPVDDSSLSDCANRITAGLRAIGVNPDEILPKPQYPSPKILSELLVIRSELKELAQQRATDDNDAFNF